MGLAEVHTALQALRHALEGFQVLQGVQLPHLLQVNCEQGEAGGKVTRTRVPSCPTLGLSGGGWNSAVIPRALRSMRVLDPYHFIETILRDKVTFKVYPPPQLSQDLRLYQHC